MKLVTSLVTFWLVLNCVSCSFVVEPGPAVKATRGEIWPKPKVQSSTENYFGIDPVTFQFKVTGHTCDILDKAIERYYGIVFSVANDFGSTETNAINSRNLFAKQATLDYSNFFGFLDEVEVHLKEPCEEWPYFEMDESYRISLNKFEYKLQSSTIWGILRALESFSQMVISWSGMLRINSTLIMDRPRFPHRGLLVDTSRHFISLPILLQILDGMAYNKLNVFHWHIVDDQSFPYHSVKFPELSEKGAYHRSMIYSPEDVQTVLEEARLRGIRVMPEFDTPGHTRSWGESHPELLTPCFGKLGPIDPTKESTYAFLSELFQEVTGVFPDRYFHLGGDEVAFDCWQSNSDITEFMDDNQIVDYGILQARFTRRVVDLVDRLNKSSLVWQEVYENADNLPDGTVVQVWTGDQKQLLKQITGDGLPALLSACWYLDHLSWGGDWQKFYNCEPRAFPGTQDQKKLVMGGEACMWGEVVNDRNILQRIFPRVSGVAEKLWSQRNVNDTVEAAARLEEHVCRMNRRGIPAQPPNGPGYCL
ncbi:beta-hexosaminidase beta chain [Culex quinquefasciatus]|uniref:Beta-hexosaminidase n=1 Tax=Culex quinquefasciatus TaxID=7176 RepID=B0XBN6_CULQU|nr:beta-hexosaminidase beta chain [Culex quinquefasciatus]|eukprot:XP_001867058.1 beta-hexosaminidase beta chain [Culex quinquefasciatus]